MIQYFQIEFIRHRRTCGKKEAVMEQFLTDDDLFGLLEELEQEEAEIEIMEDEMEASSRRFEEIIKKHKND